LARVSLLKRSITPPIWFQEKFTFCTRIVEFNPSDIIPKGLTALWLFGAAADVQNTFF